MFSMAVSMELYAPIKSLSLNLLSLLCDNVKFLKHSPKIETMQVNNIFRQHVDVCGTIFNIAVLFAAVT